MRQYHLRGVLPLVMLAIMAGSGKASAKSLWDLSPDPSVPRAALVGFRDTAAASHLPSRLQNDLRSELVATGKWRLQEGGSVDSVLRRIAGSNGDCTDSCMESLGRSLDVRILFVPHLTEGGGVTHLTLMEIHLDSELVMDRADAELGEPQAGTIERLAHLVVERIADQSPARVDSAPSPSATAHSTPAPQAGYGTGAIRVETYPSHEVWVDGVAAGTSPLTLAVWPGEHRVSVVPLPGVGQEPRSYDYEYVPVVSFGYGWGMSAYGYPYRYWYPPMGRGRGWGGYHHRGYYGGWYDDYPDAIVAGAAVTAVGTGMVVAASDQPNSVWDHTYQDVTVRARDTVHVVFQRMENRDSDALTVLGVLTLVFGFVLLTAALSGPR
jgi:hypothetical protein